MEKWHSDYLMSELKSFGSMKKTFEMAVVVPIIMSNKLLEVRPVLQQFVKREPSQKYSYIDLYYPELNFAIEIDENYHDDRQEEDADRQQEITNSIRCEFKRFNALAVNFNVGCTIHEIIEIVLSKIEEKKKTGNFNTWTQPVSKTLNSLRNEFENTLFIKTQFVDGKLVIPSGPISDFARENTERVILYSGATELYGSYIGYSEFNNVSFIQSPTNPQHFSPTGSTVTQSNALNIYATDWNVPRTFVLSNNLKQND